MFFIPPCCFLFLLLKFPYDRNMKNDIKHYKQLKQMDIRVIIIWECEIKECFNYRMEILEEEIKNSKEE